MRVFVLALLMLTSMRSEAASEKIRIAMTEWAPYTGAAVKQNGLLTAISKEALSRGGYKNIEVLVYPWARAYKEAQDGKVEGLLGAGFTDERSKIFAYPEPVWVTRDVIVKQSVKYTDVKYTNFEALAPATIGVLNNTESSAYKKFENVKGITVAKVNGVEHLYKMLSLGRIDLFIEDKGALQYSLAVTYSDLKEKIDFLMPGISEDKNYLVFSKKWPGHEKATKAFTKSLKEMGKDGTIVKIAKEFGLSVD